MKCSREYTDIIVTHNQTDARLNFTRLCWPVGTSNPTIDQRLNSSSRLWTILPLPWKRATRKLTRINPLPWKLAVRFTPIFLLVQRQGSRLRLIHCHGRDPTLSGPSSSPYNWFLRKANSPISMVICCNEVTEYQLVAMETLPGAL